MSHREISIVVLLMSIAGATCTRRTAWRDPSPHRTQFVIVDDNVQVEVLDWGGSGRPLVLLAGMGNTAHIYDEFAPRLTADYHPYGITRRGYGASSIPQEGYTADRLADDVLHVVDSLGLTKPVLVGHSLGGEELSSIGSRHPDRVGGLIYLDAAYRHAYNPILRPGDLPVPASADIALPQPPAPTSRDMASFHALRAWFIRFPGFGPPEAALRQEFQSEPDGRVGRLRTPPRVEKAILAGTQKYTDIRAPALAIYALPHDQGPWVNDDATARAAAQAAAVRDMASTGGLADAFERGVPGARVVRLAHANHYVFMSNEADVLREMRAFVSNLH